MQRFIPLNPIQWLTLALAVVMAWTIPFMYFRIQDVQHHQNDALRSVICLAEGFVRHAPHLSSEQRHQSLKFYDTALSDAHLNPCTK